MENRKIHTRSRGALEAREVSPAAHQLRRGKQLAARGLLGFSIAAARAMVIGWGVLLAVVFGGWR